MGKEYKVKEEDLNRILNKLADLPYKYANIINEIVTEINKSFVEIKEEEENKESYPPEDNSEEESSEQVNY